MTPEELELLAWFQANSEQIRSRADSYVRTLWGRLSPSRNYGDASMAWLTQEVSVMADEAQRAMSELTQAYLDGTARLAGSVVPPREAVNVTTEALRGVTSEELYGRAAPTVYGALSRGDDIEKAAKLGMDRMLKQVATTIQLAKTHTSQKVLERQGDVVGYRRVPEGAYTCALCLVASTQRYHVGDLMPIHPGCDCSVAPIRGTSDPGLIIEPERLDAIHKTMEAQFGDWSQGARDFTQVEGQLLKYRDVLIETKHGEIGPVLGWKHHKPASIIDRFGD